jgi:hypothetical protein
VDSRQPMLTRQIGAEEARLLRGSATSGQHVLPFNPGGNMPSSVPTAFYRRHQSFAYKSTPHKIVETYIQHDTHSTTPLKFAHRFPYDYIASNQLVLICFKDFFFCFVVRAASIEWCTYRIDRVWSWLTNLALIRPTIQHQVLLKHRENFKNRSIGMLSISEIGCKGNPISF